MRTITGTEWRITEIDGEPIAADEGGRPVRLRLDDAERRFAASAGCNNMIGAYRIEREALIFGAAATTMMMCEDAVMQRERALLDALTWTRAYVIEDDDLVLLSGTGNVLVRACASTEDA